MQQRSQQEEEERIVRTAIEFDQLVVTQGWKRILDHLIERVNREIYDARTCADDPIKQQTLVIRWSAMADLLDETTGHIEQTQKERDRIIKESNGDTGSDL